MTASFHAHRSGEVSVFQIDRSNEADRTNRFNALQFGYVRQSSDKSGVLYRNGANDLIRFEDRKTGKSGGAGKRIPGVTVSVSQGRDQVVSVFKWRKDFMRD